MSQKRTVIQGLEPDNSRYGNQNNGGGNSFYTRREASSGRKRGTYVPGMESPTSGFRNNSGYQDNQDSQGDTQPANDPARKFMTSGKPIVGFAYSVSRTPAGEFWPLQMGQNTIGKDSSNDIQLLEGTVSSEHAVLVVRKMKNPERVIASISDARSTNGTMLNGKSLGFTAEECTNGDVITIGDNYELYLILLDPNTLNLHVSENFIPIEIEEEEPEYISGAISGGYTRPGYPSEQPYTESICGQGTVGIDGTYSGGNKGGTIF